jgi:hypothetical protein
MADAPLGAQPRASRDDRGHQFVRVQRAFHQRLCLAFMHQLHGDFRRCMTVRHVDDGQIAEFKFSFSRDSLKLGARRHEDRRNQAEAGGFDHRGQGVVIAWMRDSGWQWR